MVVLYYPPPPQEKSSKTAFFGSMVIKRIYLAYLAIFIYTWLFLSPGQMFWDVYMQLAQMLTQKFNDWHPTAFIFLWSLLYPILGMKSMLFVQLFAWFGSFALFTHIIYLKFIYLKGGIRRNWYFLLLPFLLMFTPYSLLTIGAVVKDTQMFYTMLLVFAILAFLTLVELEKYSQRLLLFFALLALGYAVNVRHFGLIIALPLAILWVMVAERTGFLQLGKLAILTNNSRWKFWLLRSILGLLLSLLLFLGYRYTVDKFILRTQFVRASPQIAMLDIVGTYCYAQGISALPEELFTNPQSRISAIAKLDSAYHSYPLNGDYLSELGLLKVPENLYKFWIKTILQHPWAYLRHRLNFSYQLLFFKDYFGALLSNNNFAGRPDVHMILRKALEEDYAWAKQGFVSNVNDSSEKIQEFERVLNFEVERYYNSTLVAFRYPFRHFVRKLHVAEEKLMFKLYFYTPIVLALVYFFVLLYALRRRYVLTCFLCFQALLVLGFCCFTVPIVGDLRYWSFIYIASSALFLTVFLENRLAQKKLVKT